MSACCKSSYKKIEVKNQINLIQYLLQYGSNDINVFFLNQIDRSNSKFHFTGNDLDYTDVLTVEDSVMQRSLINNAGLNGVKVCGVRFRVFEDSSMIKLAIIGFEDIID
jgi:hypothetical protein